MYNFKFLVGKGNTFFDYANLISSVTFSGRKGAAPRNISVTLFDSEGYSLQRVAVDVAKGQTCVLYEDGKEIFRGLAMTEVKKSNRSLTIKAWDNAIYLCNSKASFSYKNKRADQIFNDCCKKAELTVGSSVDTGFIIPEIVKPSSTYWDVIQEALSLTYYSTGRRFYVMSDKGKLYLKERKEVSTMPKLELTTNTESYEQERSIYDTRTRITLVTSKNETKKSYVNTELEKQIGKFAEVQTVDNDATATELNRKIEVFKEEKSMVAQSLTWAGTGITSVMAGGCVYVINSPLGLKRAMYVDEDTHTWEGGKHQMKLKLNYMPDFKKTGKKDSSNSISYKIKTNTGADLHLRKEPNGTILASMPNGSVLSSDGKTNGNWIHVNYGGTWGYAYSSYLVKQ